MRTASVDRHLVSLVQPDSFDAEQYRRLRLHVEEMASTRGLRVIAVTSPVASDGKTLTAINLAGTLAQAPGARILLIDADFRKPTVGRKLGVGKNEGGWPDLLETDGQRLQQSVRRAGSGLWVLCGSGSRGKTYELLRSPRFSQLLAEARRDYDYIVLDTPPAIPVPDSRLLSSAVDGYLVVVSANRTPRKLLAETLNLLEPSSVVGLVFNRDQRPLFGYYKKYYRQYFQSYVASVPRGTA